MSYSSKDIKGNEYLIFADKGEIEFSDKNIIFLKKVRAVIKLKNSNNIEITSDLENIMQIILILFFLKM